MVGGDCVFVFLLVKIFLFSFFVVVGGDCCSNDTWCWQFSGFCCCVVVFTISVVIFKISTSTPHRPSLPNLHHTTTQIHQPFYPSNPYQHLIHPLSFLQGVSKRPPLQHAVRSSHEPFLRNLLHFFVVLVRVCVHLKLFLPLLLDRLCCL